MAFGDGALVQVGQHKAQHGIETAMADQLVVATDVISNTGNGCSGGIAYDMNVPTDASEHRGQEYHAQHCTMQTEWPVAIRILWTLQSSNAHTDRLDQCQVGV
jgi:hypothetical protein